MRFQTSYAVMLDLPVDEVFTVLALADDLERLLRLSPLVTHFRLVGEEPGPVISFEFGERVPLVAGYAASVTMRVEQTVDRQARRVDYRSRTKSGASLKVHKVRTFEPAGDATRVHEVIHGEAPFGLHLVAGRTARRAHVEHMDSYHRLFGEQPR